MANYTYKCKMCGGKLNVTEGTKIVECEYCGSVQPIHSFDSEKKNNLINRANSLRLDLEFDKSESVYENIVAEFPDEAEAYWGLCLCKYGIEYVDDALTGKKVSTCNRTCTTSIFDDNDYKKVLQFADAATKPFYIREAEEFDRLQKKILQIAANEKPYDIFICFKQSKDDDKAKSTGEITLTEDCTIAQDIYTELVKEGYKVFFSRVTLRGIAGEEYEPYIYSALSSSKLMLAIGTKTEYLESVWVKNEWSRYLKMMGSDKSKHFIACFKYIEAEDLPKGFRQLQALDMDNVTFYKDLVDNIKRILPKFANKQKTATNSVNLVNDSIKELALDNGGLFVGEAMAGKPHGNGTCIYENGDKYEGSWKFGKYNGKGKYFYANGDCYEGEFSNGERNGNGILTRPDGTSWKGVCLNIQKIY